MISFLSENSFQLAGVLGVLALNAILVAAEIALVRLRFSHFNPDLLDYMEKQPKLQRVMQEADAFIQGFRLAITFCLLTNGVLLVAPLRAALGEWDEELFGGYAIFSSLAALSVAGALHYLVADLVPRGLGSAAPVRLLRWFYWPLIGLSWMLRPLTKALQSVGGILLRLMCVEESRPLAPLEMEAQLEMMGGDGSTVPVAVQKILRNTLQMRDLVVSDVLLPRNQVKIFDLQESNKVNLELARTTGHTRFPLCDGDLDRCLGLIHVKDLFRSRKPVETLDFRRLKREMIRVDAEEPLEDALTKMLGNNVHMALVIDDFRGVEGVLTLERILEQLVGDIRDEFDFDEDDNIRPSTSEGEVLQVDGLTPLHELEEHFAVDLSNEEVSTVSGLITLEMGRIPEVGESVEVNFLRFEVLQVDETRVREALVRPLNPDGVEENADEV